MLSLLRKVALIVLVATAAVVAILIGFYAYLQTDAGRARVTAEIIQALTAIDNVGVEIEGLGGSIPFAPDVERLRVHDANGPWLEIDDLAFAVDPWGLPYGRVVVDYIEASGVHFLRMPKTGDDDVRLPRLPLVVRVDSLNAAEVTASPELAAEIASAWKTLSVRGSGRVDMLRHRLDTEWKLTGEDLSFASDRVSIARADAELKVGGTFGEPSFDVGLRGVQVDCGAVSSGRLEIDAAIESEDAADGWALAVTSTMESSGFRSPDDVARLLGEHPALALAGRIVPAAGAFDFTRVRLNAAETDLEGRVARDAAGTFTVTNFAGTVRDVGAIGSLHEILAGASASISGNGKATADESIAADFTVRLDGGGVPDPTVAAALGSAVVGDFALSMEPSGDARLTVAKLETAVVRMTGVFRYMAATEAVDGDASVTLSQLERLQLEPLEIAGGAQAAVRLDGRLDRLSVHANAAPEAMRINGRSITGGEVVVAIDELPDALRGGGTLHLDSDGIQLSASLDGALDEDGSWRIESFELDGLATHASGHAAGAAFDKPFSGRVDVRLDDAEAWGAILGRHLRGNGELTATFDGSGAEQGVSLTAALQDAEVSLREMPEFAAAELSLRADVDNWRERRIRNAVLEGAGLEFGLGRFETLNVSAESAGEVVDVSVRAAGSYLDEFTIEADGGVRCPECDRRSVEVDSLIAAWQAVPIRLNAPVEFVVDGEEFEMRGLDLSVDSGFVRGDWVSTPSPGRGSVVAQDVPIGVATIFDATFPFTGRLNANVSAAQAPDAPLRIDLLIEELRLADAAAADLAPVRFEFEGEIAGRSLTFATSTTAGSDADVKIEGVVPLRVRDLSVDPNGRLRASAVGQVQAGFLGGLVLPPTERVRGRIDVDFQVAGTPGDPSIRGAARAKQMSFSSSTTGLRLRGAQLEILADGASLELVRFEADDGHGGTLVASGDIDFATGDGSPEYLLELTLDKLRMVNLDELNVTAGGKVRLTGKGREPAVEGKLTATSADLQLPERLPPEVVVIEVNHVNQGERFADSGAPEDVPIPVALDVLLDFPGRVSVHAPGLISEWRGQVRVNGTTEDPEINGELKLIRGTVATAGIRFRLTEGRFLIDHDLSVPEVDLVAETSRNDVKAKAVIRGPINDPSFELTSDPPLPEDEILSRLLFGTTPGRLTALQSVQLAQAVARFSGLTSGNDPLYRLQRSTGIDRVEIKGGDEEGQAASISVGKYLTDRIFLSLDQGLTGRQSTARVEVDLTDHLSAQTQVGQDATAGVGVQWRISY